MQAMHHFRLELWHATMPTYVASYLFPFLLLVYETRRTPDHCRSRFPLGSLVGATSRSRSSNCKCPGWVGCSIGILVFDFVLQYAL
jgi:hypothetical protein